MSQPRLEKALEDSEDRFVGSDATRSPICDLKPAVPKEHWRRAALGVVTVDELEEPPCEGGTPLRLHCFKGCFPHPHWQAFAFEHVVVR